MSRRKRRARREPRPGTPAPAESGGAPRRSRPLASGLARDVALLALVFAAASGLAELLGAANLGTALGIGQIAFALALVALLLLR